MAPQQVMPIPKRGAKNPVTKAIARFNNWDLLAMFDPKRARPSPRTVLVNVPIPPEASTSAPKIKIPGLTRQQDVQQPDGTVVQRKVAKGWGHKVVPSEGWIFESNQVLTSKYNIITFLPRNLLEQFRRVANVFFLGESVGSPRQAKELRDRRLRTNRARCASVTSSITGQCSTELHDVTSRDVICIMHRPAGTHNSPKPARSAFEQDG